MLRILVIFLCAFVFTLPVVAQDKTAEPNPNQGFILSSAGEVIFPQAVRFTVAMSVTGDNLASAALTIQPDGQQLTAVEVKLPDAITLKEPYAALAYVWNIPSANPPQLFRDIRFTWKVVSKQGQTAEFNNRITFTDQRAKWVQYKDNQGRFNLTLPIIDRPLAAVVTPQTPPTIVPIASETFKPEATADAALNQTGTTVVPLATPAPITAKTPDAAQVIVAVTIVPAEDADARRLSRGLSPIYDLLAINSSQKPSLNALIYPFTPGCVQNAKGDSVAISPITHIEIPCDATLAAIIFRASGYVVIQTESAGLNVMQAALVDYATRQFYETAWRGKNVPAWFQMGLAQFYTPGLKTRYVPLLTSAGRSGKLLSLEQMSAAPNQTNADLWQAQSYGMTMYIAGQVGVQGLFDLARNVSQSDSFAAAYEKATGKPLAALPSDFQTWIFTDAGSSAFAFTPYQAATATPTQTDTPTPIATAVPSETPTFTLTPTVTGVHTVTPYPTRTATRTPTPLPPTITPRPPGSLDTPTPIPTAVPVNPLNALNNPNVALSIFGIGLLLIAILILLLMRARSEK
jgi:hypothetical protein